MFKSNIYNSDTAEWQSGHAARKSFRLTSVDEVFQSIDRDETVIESIKKDINRREIELFLQTGGDRKNGEYIPEYEICKKNNIEMIFDVGGEKVKAKFKSCISFINYKEERPWGNFENLIEGKKISC